MCLYFFPSQILYLKSYTPFNHYNVLTIHRKLILRGKSKMRTPQRVITEKPGGGGGFIGEL